MQEIIASVFDLNTLKLTAHSINSWNDVLRDSGSLVARSRAKTQALHNLL